MKLRIKSTIQNDDRARRTALKEVRKPIEDSHLTSALKKLFRVKHADNDTLFNNLDDPERNVGGHYTLTVGINPRTEDVSVVILKSLEDLDGNSTKQDKVDKNFIYPIPEDKITGNPRKSGVDIDVYRKNLVENRNLNWRDLEEPYREIIVSKEIQSDVARHIFENETHKKISKRNKKATESMLKIK